MFITRHRLFPVLHDDEETAGGAEPTSPAAEGEPTPPTTEETGQPTSEQPNWEERYKEAQAWGTRLSQERSELETDAQLVRALRSGDDQERLAALEALGLALADDGEEEHDEQLYDEVPPSVRAELDELRAFKEELTSREQQTVEQQEQEAQYAAYRDYVDPQLEQLGVPEGFYDVVAEAALNLPVLHTPQGQLPDIEGAWQQVLAMADTFAQIPEVQKLVKQSWAQSKPGAAVTRTGGQAGHGAPQFANGEERRAHIISRMQADQ